MKNIILSENVNIASCQVTDSVMKQSHYSPTNTCYTIYKDKDQDKVSWFKAYERCNSIGAQLLTIGSQAIEAHIKALLDSIVPDFVNNTVNGAWMGLHSSNWKWVDGE